MPARTLPAGFQGTFRTDERARSVYAEGAGIYRIVPSAVAIPETTGDLVALVRWALEAGQSLILRGAGSAVSGSSVGHGVIVDLTRMRPGHVSIDPDGQRAVTGPGVTWQTLTDAAARHGLRLPPDPSSGAFATLGGMVATNAAGARSLRFGPVRPWVQALDTVTVNGEVCRLERGVPSPDCSTIRRFVRDAAPAIHGSETLIRERFPRTTKNTSGLALDAFLDTGEVIDLFIGSEGTLGITTNIEWRLAPVPPYAAGLLIRLGDLDALPDVVTTLKRLDPTAIELLDRSFLDIVPAEDRPSGAVVLLVEFEGENDKTLRARVGDAVRAISDRVEDVRTALSRAETDALWRLRHAASPMLAGLPESRRSLQVIEDGCVPLDRLAEYLAFVRTAAEDLEVPFVIFGHAGDGHLHVNLLPDVSRSGWEAPVQTLMLEVTNEVLRLGGTPSGEHGDGRLRAGLIERVYGTEIMALFRKVKDTFDPQNILNPGIMFPEDWSPLHKLKTGVGAVSLPDDIAESLRELERSADYGAPRLQFADRT